MRSHSRRSWPMTAFGPLCRAQTTALMSPSSASIGDFDGLLSLLDRRGQRIDGVPPQLVHRARRIGKLRVGDIVCVQRAESQRTTRQ